MLKGAAMCVQKALGWGREGTEAKGVKTIKVTLLGSLNRTTQLGACDVILHSKTYEVCFLEG